MSDHYKQGAANQQERGRRVKKLNKTYLGISFILLVLLTVIERIDYNAIVYWPVLILYPSYYISRCNEIFMAFIQDAFDKLNPMKRKENGLHYYERIQMALRSYIELIINYTMLYYMTDTFYKYYQLNGRLFNQPLNNLFNAFYFSVVTVVSIGYGEYYPVHPISKFIVIHEVLTGMLLVVVSFTIYVNLNFEK